MVTREHLQGRPVAGESLGVGEEELEPVTTAAGTRGLHVAVLVIDGRWGRRVVVSVAGGSDGGVEVLFTGLDICNVLISSLERLQLDGTFRLDNTQELEIVAGVDVNTSSLSHVSTLRAVSILVPPPASGVLVNLDTRSQRLPDSLRFF